MMRSRVAPLLVVAFFLGCDPGRPATVVGVRSPAQALQFDLAATPGQSASGHVEHDFTEFGVPIEKYSFTAVRQPDGSVAGRFQVRDVFVEGGQMTVEGAVVCLTILPDGKTARVGGVIDLSSEASFVGRDALWTVIDNGEGANSAPDDATDLRFGPSPGTAVFHCSTGINLPTLGPNMRGDVQVQP